jgi:Tfp pilus assembly protein PilN
MRPIDIDFARSAQLMRISGWPLVAAAIVAAVAVGNWWAEASAEYAKLEAAQSQASRARTDENSEPRLEQEVGQANEAIEQIALPWDRLFAAVEGAALPGVNLLGISPDARTGSVRLSAETRDAEAMFEYARRLADQPGLARVYLVEHHVDSANEAHPVQFGVTASWLEVAP